MFKLLSAKLFCRCFKMKAHQEGGIIPSDQLVGFYFEEAVQKMLRFFDSSLTVIEKSVK